MRKSILALTLLTAVTTVNADQKWLFTTPELLLTGGASIAEDREALSIKFAVQETLCYTAKHFCINPSVMWLVRENDETNSAGNGNDFSDKINIGMGVDVKYKFPKTSNNGVYAEAGPVGFVKDFNDDRVTLHVGTGVEYKRYILSIDSYGTSDSLYMINFGYRL